MARRVAVLASVVRAAGSAAGGARDIGDRRPRVCDDREQLRRRPQLDAGVEVPAADSGVSQYDLPVSSCGWVTQFWQLTVFMLGKTVAGLAAVLPCPASTHNSVHPTCQRPSSAVRELRFVRGCIKWKAASGGVGPVRGRKRTRSLARRHGEAMRRCVGDHAPLQLHLSW